MDEFRRKHLADLQLLSASSGTSLGYGFENKKDSTAASTGGSTGGEGAPMLSPAAA